MDMQEIDQILASKCGLTKPGPLLVGFSGGPDSLCLLDVLQRLGYGLIVAHFNHHIRPEANDDALRVAAMVTSRGLPFILGEGDVVTQAKEGSVPVEEAARVMRYEFLFEQARRARAQAVAVGHTADDQVETVLMHMLRGAGLAGLKGMAYASLNPAWDALIPLVRPLLGVWREETVAYCAEFDLHPLIDASNRDTTYFRNRLRHELIPFLESYNPRLRPAIWRMALALSGDFDTVQEVSRQAFLECLREKGTGYIAFDFRELKNLPPGALRGVIRLAIAGVRPELRDVDFDSVERALDFIGHPSRSGKMDLLGGLSLVAEDERLYLIQEKTQLPVGVWPRFELNEPICLEAPGTIKIAKEWMLSVEWVDAGTGSLIDRARDAAPYEAWLDGEHGLFPLVVRPRASGDRFQPLGLDGKWVKLSDFFINAKLPFRARASWPLVWSQGQIAWIPGYRPAHSFRLTASTRRTLHLNLEKLASSER